MLPKVYRMTDSRPSANPRRRARRGVGAPRPTQEGQGKPAAAAGAHPQPTRAGGNTAASGSKGRRYQQGPRKKPATAGQAGEQKPQAARQGKTAGPKPGGKQGQRPAGAKPKKAATTKGPHKSAGGKNRGAAPAKGGGKQTRGTAKTGREAGKKLVAARRRSARPSRPAPLAKSLSWRAHSSGSPAEMQVRAETSAGGLVVSGLCEAVDTQGNVDLSRIYAALIGRLDRRGRLLWSMPKGHVEPGELHATTAAREVWEETGIAGTVVGDLGLIDYWFVSDGVRIHKTVHHFLLHYVAGECNDEDPEVTEVQWVPVNDLVELLAYADERKLAALAITRLPSLARETKAQQKASR